MPYYTDYTYYMHCPRNASNEYTIYVAGSKLAREWCEAQFEASADQGTWQRITRREAEARHRHVFGAYCIGELHPAEKRVKLSAVMLDIYLEDEMDRGAIRSTPERQLSKAHRRYRSTVYRLEREGARARAKWRDAVPSTPAHQIAEAHGRYLAMMDRLDREGDEARAEWRDAVREAVAAGVSLREAEEITGLDHARILQIAQD